MKLLANVHPGEILEKDFLIPMAITAYGLAKAIKVDQTRISQIINGKRSISADTSLRLAKFFNMSAEFWLNAQNRYDLVEERDHNKEYEKIKPFQKVYD